MKINLSSNEILKELDISRSTFYYFIKNNIVDLEQTSNGRYIWTESALKKLKIAIEKQKITPDVDVEPELKTSKINNRRYLGNKYKLLGFIKGVVKKECKGINTVADIFSGTGAVASGFKNKKVITNDFLYFNYICNYAWFGAEKYDKSKMIELIKYYNQVNVYEDNYMSENFGNTFFSIEDCRKIGYIRENVEQLFKVQRINERERALLLTSLLYAMDKIANTCGHYDAYRKSGVFNSTLELTLPLASNNNNPNNQCFNEDANSLVNRIEADLVYIDPPYNSRQYCDAYHVLENVARWEKPEVFGVAKKMNRDNLKSDYCTVNAASAFEDLIKKIKSKYILLSYNNMGNKGDSRSNAKITDEEIMRILSTKGRVKIFTQEHKAFTTGKSDIQENEERLFLCECYDYSPKKIIQSPLNYVGGKFKLLPQILPHFPSEINNFVDLFCGGGNVGINVNCSKVLFNDNNALLRMMFNTFKNLDKDVTFSMIDSIIEKYGLTDTSKNGYEFYNCNSSDGLGKVNSKGYLKLRKDFNTCEKREYRYYIMLYVLIIFSFNNQIRFNQKGEYNLPVGKRDFNSKMRMKLDNFIDRLKSGDYIFESLDFRDVDSSKWDEGTFVYCDPPYLLSCATYNEKNGWNEELECELLKYLDHLNNRKIKFALSNVLRSKGKSNDILLEWINKNKNKYRVVYLNYTYSNSNYQRKDRSIPSEEVLILNY